MSQPTQKNIPFLTPLTGLFLALVALFAGAAVWRLAVGLGPATNLNDDIPWGLWVGVDILVGVALAAGGFTMAAAVYVFNMKLYKPLARPAVLTAFVGYIMVSVGVFFDIGKPFSLWHPLVMWQPHSIMFEVVWCVVLYSTVLALEFAPTFLEGIGQAGAAKVLRSKPVLLPLVIAAVTLSFLHQSSLGALFLLMAGRLSDLYWTTMLPYNFFLSAIAVGLAMVSFETIVAGRVLNHQVDPAILKGVARGTANALIVYAVVRLGDLAVKGHLGLAFAGDTAGTLFLVETIGGVLLPMALLFTAGRSTGNATGTIFIAQTLVIAGVVVNRLSVNFLAQAGGSQTYQPAFPEIAITVGLLSAIVVLYRLVALYLPLFGSKAAEPAS